jgi:hypothetical protein
VACLTNSLAWMPLNGRSTICGSTHACAEAHARIHALLARSHSIHCITRNVYHVVIQYYHFYTENSELLGGGARQFKTTAAAPPHCPVCTSTDRASIPFHLCDDEKKIAPPLFISPSLREKLVLLACTCGSSGIV